MSPRQRVEQMVSAGGVVYRIDNGEVALAICGSYSPLKWGLPKGTPEPGEDHQQTALREVTEETGLEVQTEGSIGSIDYWFVRSADRVRCHKTVYYYLMSVTGGDVALHDHEFDTVEWFPGNEALKTLTYENEVGIVQKGLTMVSEKTGIG